MVLQLTPFDYNDRGSGFSTLEPKQLWLKLWGQQ